MTHDNDFLITDSITRLGPDPAGRVTIAASHGGAYCGYQTAKARLRGVVLHDAGVGKDAAGIGALAYLDDYGVPAATADQRSARIGDGEDLAERGRISHVNAAAARLGCVVGQTVRECAERMQAASLQEKPPPDEAESRALAVEGNGGAPVWLCDSNALVRADDEGSVVVTGSHGAVLAQDPTWKGPWVRGALFNDAGGGAKGTSRLPMLDGYGIAGATVDAFSARIGEARSTYADGVLSALNTTAERAGLQVGMPAREAVEILRRLPARG